MIYNLGTEDDPILVNVRYSGGTLDAVIRCDDYATFQAAALYAELTYEVMETVVDPETLEETQVGTGVILTAKGVHIDHIGAMQITAGTYDDEGAELTAPTFDTRHHVNFRLTAPAVNAVDDYGVVKWHKWAMAWAFSGTNDTNANANEEAVKLIGVSLINADTIRSPSRVFL